MVPALRQQPGTVAESDETGADIMNLTAALRAPLAPDEPADMRSGLTVWADLVEAMYANGHADEGRADWEATLTPGPTRQITSHHRHLHRLGERDGWFCSYCDVPLGCPCRLGLEPAVSDHVFPKSRGGSDADENRALACRTCNLSKTDMTPEEWGGP